VGDRDHLESLPTGTLGQYRVRARIGSGGMGDVFDAVHVSLDKRVAIKTLRRRFLEDQVVVARFLREGQLASRMRHPNIVDVTDVGVIDGLPCLVMEHLEGETLGQVVRRDGPMRPSALVDLLLPIIAAVDFAHDHGVLHRDLKPSNIFLARSWNGEVHPKVLDFGISKLVHESTEAALTTDSAFVGTPHYASPESVRAERAADRRSDQYSMGVILYEGSTGARPFASKGGSFVTMAMAICNGDFPPPREFNPDLPEAFERVILRAMSLEADDRFAGMRDLGAALLPFASDRARVIWAPTFDAAGAGPGSDGREGHVSHETQVLRSTSGSPALAAYPASSPSHAGGTGPSQQQGGWPASGVRPYPPGAGQAGLGQTGPGRAIMASSPPSFGGMSGGTPPPMGMGGEPYRHHVPMGMVHEPTPSFGAGINSSIPVLAPKKSSGAVIAIALGALAIVGVGLITVVVTRSSARRGASGADPESGAQVDRGPTFEIDVQATPDSAVMELDGVSVGSGRLTKQLPRDGQKHVLRVSAPGYEALLVEFDATRPPPSILGLRSSAAPGGGGAVTATGDGAGGKGVPGVIGGKPPVVVAPAGGPNVRPQPNVKGKPERPRTDNIDPWE
jgi:serine/threonine-protein kinase